MSRDEIPEPTALQALVILALLPATILVEGWAIGVLWRQNATPLGAWALTNWDTTGLVLLAVGLRLTLQRNRKNEFTPSEIIANGLAEMMSLALFVGLSTWVTG